MAAMNESLHPSENCFYLVKACESCRLEAYLDPSGIPTIGYGHTEQVQLGQCCTLEQAEGFLSGDLQVAAGFVRRSIVVRLNQHQFDALCDFVFNVKLIEFLRSTLRQYLNEGNYAAAAQEFPRWVYCHVNGKPVKEPGLVARRAKEQTLFLEPVG